MNSNERTIARILFQNKIYKSDGQAYEDIFVAAMSYKSEDFKSIKPWGNLGDRKNDGYIKSKGEYYQVFAPEDIRKSYVDVVNKIKKDFLELIQFWPSVHKFFFVVNDKYKGVNAICERTITEIMETYSLEDARILTSKDLENLVFSLEDDMIFAIVGNLPDPGNLKNVDYSILNEVITHIMNYQLVTKSKFSVTLPDLDEKISFNNLTNSTADFLYNGLMKVVYFEEYLSNNSDFVADTLRDKLNEMYVNEKMNFSGDYLFWRMVNNLSPIQDQKYQSIVIIIMSKYFESCDIFEEPILEVENVTSY